MLALGLLLPALAAQTQSFAQTSERVATRFLLFEQKDGRFRSQGQVCIDFTPPEWKKDYNDDKKLDQMTRGQRMRFGKDFWSRLDTSVPLDLGGIKVPAGSYYLALERSKDDKWSLVLLDPARMREQRVDAFDTASTKGGTLVPLTCSRSKESQERLKIEFLVDKKDSRKAILDLHWGTYKLSTPLTAEL